MASMNLGFEQSLWKMAKKLRGNIAGSYLPADIFNRM